MANQDSLSRTIQPGSIIKPWLILGPLYQDLSAHVQGLTCFERAGATVGCSAMTEIVQHADEILLSTPYEGESVTWRGEAARWSLVRRPEKYLSWGQYNISNHLGAAFLSTVLTPETAGMHTWRLITRITSRTIVALNGTIVYDTENHPTDQVSGSFERQFTGSLESGDNVLTLAMFRLGRMAQVGSRLEVVDGIVHAHTQANPHVSSSERAQTEVELAGVRLSQDIFYPEHPVALELLQAPQSDLQIDLWSEETKVCSMQPTTGGTAQLCSGKDLADGDYTIQCTWRTRRGDPITSTTYAIRKVTPVSAPTGYDRLPERKRLVLKHYADNEESRPIWTQVARYALEQYDRVDERALRDTCAFIAARKDCADFVIQGLLRIMYWERKQQHLSDEINAMMKDTVLGFKYWVDEPGDTVMYMGSENHRLLFHVAEWMAGQLYPTEEFTNSRQRGLYHATKGRMYITEWLRQRGRFGFDEWHSNSYYPITIAPIVNVLDFCIHEDYKLGEMAAAVLDYAFFNLAADSFQGILGTTHGRSYGRYVKYPDMEGTSSTCWLLYGTGSLVKGTSGMAPVTIATSRYQLPKILFDIANDREATIEARVRQGILRGTSPHANFCVYRTPDYMISGLQDHRKGEYESSTHVAQVTLGNKAVVFWSCPHTSGEGSGLRPDYWSGHTTLPRVIQYRNVLSLTWRLSEFAWMTHCFFERSKFDQILLTDHWAFAQVGKGYVAIYSQHGMHLGESGQYAGRELICEATENTWLVECGREADYGSFGRFVQTLQSAQITIRDETVQYDSPAIGTFATGWDAVPTVNGEPIQLAGYPLVDSPWAFSRFGSGELTIRYQGQEREIWFNQ